MATGSDLNILFITADQWRGDCLGAAGHPVVRTPNLDGLAGDGVLFRRHYAQCAPCGPSRASIYTGMYLQNHRVCINGTPLDARFTNLALEARSLGYRPALFGYTDQAVDPRHYPPDAPELWTYEGVLPGFDAVVDLREDFGPWRAWLREKGHAVPERPRDIFKPRPDHPGAQGRGRSFAPPVYSDADSETNFLTGEAIRYIRDFRAREPDAAWFAHLSYYRPHPPYIAPEPFNALYDPADVPWPPKGAKKREEEAALHPWLAWALAQRPHDGLLDEHELRQLRATYYGMISQVDASLGRLFNVLRETGEWARTAVIFTSDHGDQLGDHRLLGKLGFFDESYHVPLIIRDPRAEADGTRGSIVDRFTENVDLMPTILALAGGEAPAQCDGHPLTPFLEGRALPDWREAACWEYDFRDPETRSAEDNFTIRADDCSLNVIRTERFKYVHFTALPALLFDLAADPDEGIDRSGDPAYAGEMLDCAQKLLSWRIRNAERTLTGYKLTARGPFLAREGPRRSRD